MPFKPYYWFTAYSQHQSDMARWRKTIKPWQGPVKQAYIPLEGEPTVLDITNGGDMYRIRDLDLSNMIAVATEGSNGTWQGEYMHPVDHRSVHVVFTDEGTAYPTLEAITADLRMYYNNTVAEEAMIAASPTLQLERILKRRDWTGHMSDDHAYWSAAMRSDRELKAILPQVPAEDVRRLWAEHAPDDIPCPV